MAMKITLINENGESQTTDLVTVFSTERKYAITTNNELDPNGLTILHVSEVDGEKLNPVTDDSSWDNVKNVMRSIISGSGELNIVYESAMSQASVSSSYSRDISVEAAAKDVLANDYQTKKPAEVVETPVVEAGAEAPNPFNGVYPTEGVTPVVQNMGDVPVGSQIAPGISEVPAATEFQTVNSLENPVDLIVGQENEVQNEVPVAQAPVQEQPSVAPVTQTVENNQAQMGYSQPAMPQNMNPEQNMAVQYPAQPQVEVSVDNQLQSLISGGATEEQIREVVLQKIGAVITNYVDYLGMKTSEELNRRKAELDRREAEINIMRQGIEAKLSGQFGNQQVNVNTQPVYPVQQPGFNEVNNMQQMVYQQPEGGNSFRPVA